MCNWSKRNKFLSTYSEKKIKKKKYLMSLNTLKKGNILKIILLKSAY